MRRPNGTLRSSPEKRGRSLTVLGDVRRRSACFARIWCCIQYLTRGRTRSDAVADDRIEPTLGFEEQRDEAILATPTVSATVDGASWKGSGEVLLALCPRPAIEIPSLFDSGVGSGPEGGMKSVRDQMTEVVVDGHVVAGFAAEASPHFDDDGVKVLVEWRPGVLPVQAVGENGTRMERVRFSLFNFDLPGEPYHNGTGFARRLALSDDEWSVTIQGLVPPNEVWRRINKDGGVHLTHAGSVSRIDGADFTGAQAREMLEMLAYFLAFATGRRATACCPVGTVGADVVWSMWSPPERWNRGGNRGSIKSARSRWASCFRLSWRDGVRKAAVTHSARRSTGTESPTTRRAE